jgi:hypothetical protein
MSTTDNQDLLLSSPGAINLPPHFQIHAVKFKGEPQALDATFDAQVPIATADTPPLGVLEKFKGCFFGHGFNTIWRPNNKVTTTGFDVDVTDPVPPTPPHEAVLEINLTRETLSFSKSLGSVPNRGLINQQDIFLNGVPYVQVIDNVTNELTGKDDAPPTGIHFEPGLWMHVPATTVNPKLFETLNRMASIPHGTTINAQGQAPGNIPIDHGLDIDGKTVAPTGIFNNVRPKFVKSDITPFVIGNPKVPLVKPFDKIMTVANIAVPRLPQDLTKFNQSGFITDEILHNINVVLDKANDGKVFVKTIVFTVSTDPLAPNGVDGLDTAPKLETEQETETNAKTFGGGAANIAFLSANDPKTGNGENANAVKMTSTFWVNTIEHTITVPKHKPGQHGSPLIICAPVPNKGHPVTKFKVCPSFEIKKDTTIKVHSTEIQYSQNVGLNFAGLTWPHVSVATLVQSEPIEVPESAFKTGTSGS